MNYAIKAEYIEPEVVTFRTFKKRMWNGNDWETIIFYEMKKPASDRQKINEWLTTHYSSAIYSKTWWETWDGIIMNEKIYIHWKLCE